MDVPDDVYILIKPSYNCRPFWAMCLIACFGAAIAQQLPIVVAYAFNSAVRGETSTPSIIFSISALLSAAYFPLSLGLHKAAIVTV